MAEDKEPYTGPERRKQQRRKISERREEIRYEPEKEPRRKLKDRRKPSSIWDDRNGF